MPFRFLPFVCTIILLFGSSLHLRGQLIRVSDDLVVTRLSSSTYIHTYKQSNGLVFVNDGEAIIVSTPPSDSATLHLLRWVTDSLEAKIVAYVIDRWHPDAMEGLDVVHQNNIETYSYTKTRQIALAKGLPAPEVGFDPKKTLYAGREPVHCNYLGEAHTSDGIVVWIPKDKILFGGNEIRNLDGWVGNIADANLTQWPKTMRRIKTVYRDAEIVVPGHGPYGDQELIDYTLRLYNFPKDQANPYQFTQDSLKVGDLPHLFIIKAYQRKDLPDNRVAYTKGHIRFRRDEREIEIYADYFTYDMHNREMMVPSGFMRIQGGAETESFNFEGLKLNLRNDAVGMTMVIKSIQQ